MKIFSTVVEIIHTVSSHLPFETTGHVDKSYPWEYVAGKGVPVKGTVAYGGSYSMLSYQIQIVSTSYFLQKVKKCKTNILDSAGFRIRFKRFFLSQIQIINLALIQQMYR